MIEKIHLQSTLLVPMPEFAQGMSFRWIDTFRGANKTASETVNVIVFNTENKDEIKSLLEKDLGELKKIDAPNNVVSNQINFITKTLTDMERPETQHDAPEELLLALQKASNRKLTKDQVVYLSGIAGIWEK